MLTSDRPSARHGRLPLILDVATAVPWWLTAPLVRPWHLRWGATTEEVKASMPGDEIVPAAGFTATRAITVNAPRPSVWPWILQVGYGRGGFYSYDLVDNGGRPSADRIKTEYQGLEPGDAIPMFHDMRGLAIAYRVDSLEAPDWMLWVHRPHDDEPPDSTWSWRLTALPGDRTRLITRMKQDYRWQTRGLALFNLILMEFGDFAMERRMLRGIRTRAERGYLSVAAARAGGP